MKVKRATAVKLLEALGLSNVQKLSRDRLAGKMSKISDFADGETKLEDARLQSLLEKAMETCANGSDIEIEAEKEDKPKTNDAQVTDVPGGAGVTRRKRKKAKADKTPDKKPKEPAGNKVVGVRPTRGRPYIAGILIKKYGLEAGVTKEMVAEMALALNDNEGENYFALRNTWHSIRGFTTDGNEGDLKPIVTDDEE